MLTENQAKALVDTIKSTQYHCRNNHKIEYEDLQDVLEQITNLITSCVSVAADEPEQFHFKNIIAFMAIFDGQRLMDIHPAGLVQKFQRFCMSHKPDEYKWGISPPLYQKIYRYFDKYKVELDSHEKEAEKENLYDRRWGKKDQPHAVDD